ncbi:MAG: D-TA family PLP-dependent enzyme [Clostridia bacterium]|nr:D-TA family PLP-dependent enzyme [Clostridia bacterium]
MKMTDQEYLDQYRIKSEDDILTPRLVYYPEIIYQNIENAIKTAGGAERLWPHVKSHKTREIVLMQMHLGIERFKCATLAEADMVAKCGAKHILLAYPLVGPNIDMLLNLAEEYPDTTFYALEDDLGMLKRLDEACARRQATMNWLCDVNTGMNRTGVETEKLSTFVQAAQAFTHARFMGLHCYDGQNHQPSLAERKSAVDAIMPPVERVERELEKGGVAVPIVISGGSPTFSCQAERKGQYLSPGTVFVWDWGYNAKFDDLPFCPAGVVLTRVVSHPADGVFTLDAGSKALSPDTPERGYLLGAEGAKPLLQNEEHWVFSMPKGHEDERPPIGKVMYVVPWHICPTSALYDRILTVRDHEPGEYWTVAARNRF